MNRKLQASAMRAAKIAFGASHPAAKHLIADVFAGVAGKVDGGVVVVVKFAACKDGKIWQGSAYYKVSSNEIEEMEETDGWDG